MSRGARKIIPRKAVKNDAPRPVPRTAPTPAVKSQAAPKAGRAVAPPKIEVLSTVHHGGSHTPRRIILHHCAGFWDGTRAHIMRPVKAPNPVSYHFHINTDGAIRQYVDPSKVAWHAFGANTGSIGISVTGSTTNGQRRPSANLTAEEVRSIIELIRWLQSKYPTLNTITTHRAVDTRKIKDDISPAAEAQVLRALLN